MQAPRLHWMRGRQGEGPGVRRTLEWIGRDDAGEAIARVVRILGPVWTGWRSYRAVSYASALLPRGPIGAPRSPPR